MSGIIIASNRLPIMAIKQADRVIIKRSDGGLASAVGSVFGSLGGKWVGVLGGDESVVSAAQEQGYYPVAVTPEVYDSYYNQVANRLLWPLLHGLNIWVEPGKRWQDYVAVNQAFARHIMELAGSDDMIWVHDYHLMLVPQFLRELGSTHRIGFFLHTPFTAVLTQTDWGRQILRSLAMADTVGFQTKRSQQAFVTALEQLGGSTSGRHQVCFNGRQITVQAFPIGIDFAAYSRRVPNTTFYETLGRKDPGKIILSLSRLDYTKGLVQQLEAVQELVKDPHLHASFTLRLAIIPSREMIPEYQKLKRTIEGLVKDINASVAPGWQPVVYEYDFLTPDALLLAYREADIMLVTPIADGMNLVSKEYIAANPKGILILSTGAGAAEQLSEALLVEPGDVVGLVSQIRRALAMKPSVRLNRRLRQSVKTYDVHRWAHSFLRTLSGKQLRLSRSRVG